MRLIWDKGRHNKVVTYDLCIVPNFDVIYVYYALIQIQ